MNLKRLGFIVLGIILVVGGYWVGFDGETSTEYRADGPQGPGYYEVTETYPIAGIVLILGGLGVAARGVSPDEEGVDGSSAGDGGGPPPTGPGRESPSSDRSSTRSDRRDGSNGSPAHAETRNVHAGQQSNTAQQPDGRVHPGQPADSPPPQEASQGGRAGGQSPRQAGQPGPTTEVGMVCPSCGESLSPTAAFCTNCGAQVGGD